MRAILVAVGCLLAAAPAAAQTEAYRFPGNWQIADVIFGTGGLRLVAAVNRDTLTKSGDIARIQLAHVDEANGDGIRTNLIELEYDCTKRRYRITGIRDFDASHKQVATRSKFSEGAVPAGSTLTRAFNFACFGRSNGFVAESTTDLQGGALRYFAAHPKPAAPSGDNLPAEAARWFAGVEKECSEDDRFNLAAYALHRKQMKTQAESDRSRRDYIAEQAKWRKLCIENRARRLNDKGKALLKPRLDRLQDESVAYYTDLNSKARAAFEANVSAHTFIAGKRYKDDTTVGELKTILKGYRNFRTIAQTCGTFDYSMPYLDNAYIKPRDRRRLEYGKCIEDYRKRKDGLELGDIDFSIATTEVLALAPYVCSRHKVAGCIKDKDWKAFYAVANEKNLAYIKKMDDLRSHERYTRSRDEIDRLNKWLENLNAAVKAHNKAVRGY